MLQQDRLLERSSHGSKEREARIESFASQLATVEVEVDRCLYKALYVHEGGEPFPESILDEPQRGHYFEGSEPPVETLVL